MRRGYEYYIAFAAMARALEYGEEAMLGWAVTFLVIALVAALFGFGGLAGAAAGIAQLLFFVFIAIFLVSLIMGLMRGRTRV